MPSVRGDGDDDDDDDISDCTDSSTSSSFEDEAEDGGSEIPSEFDVVKGLVLWKNIWLMAEELLNYC